MNTNNGPAAVLDQYLDDPTTGWSIGAFGALAEFARAGDEPVERHDDAGTATLLSPLGALRVRLDDAVRLIPYEALSRFRLAWSQGVVVCLDREAAAMAGHSVITELGPDTEAIRSEDRNSIAFDIGLDIAHIDCRVRTADAGLLAVLRGATGKPPLDGGQDALAAIKAVGPHRVFASRLGRIEVYQPIPSGDGATTPMGPHTHVMPRLLAHRRDQAATLPVPDGLVPALALFPPNPVRDGDGGVRDFDRATHDAFQGLMARFAASDIMAAKRLAWDALAQGHGPERLMLPTDRHVRTALRVAVRQAHHVDGPSAALEAWQNAVEPVGTDDPDLPADHD